MSNMNVNKGYWVELVTIGEIVRGFLCGIRR